MKYTHRDIEITFHKEQGNFTATVGGKFTRKSSLDAIKKWIDKAAENAFVPFTALTLHFGSPSLEEVTVTGIKKTGKRKYGNTHEWEVCRGDRTYSTSAVAANTPDNVQRVTEYIQKRKELHEWNDRKEKELQAIYESIEKLSPHE